MANNNGKKFSKEYQPDQKWKEETAIKLGEDLIEWLKEKDEDGDDKGNMFFEEYLVIERDLYPGIIKYLSTKFLSFFKLIEKAKKIQELKLTKYGVGDRLNSTMTKFTLVNNHGWSDRKEIEATNTNLNIDLDDKERKEALERVQKGLNEFKDYE